MRQSERGNAVVFILIGIALFGALAYTFMKGSRQGQGNLTAQQSKMAAQELISFFNSVQTAVDKLRLRGCAESDISFVSAKDTNGFEFHNDSSTAPPDKSCHVFDPAGGGVNMNMQWEKYQIPINQISAANQVQHGNIYFKLPNYAVLGIGTSTNDVMTHLNWVQKDICSAYNQILNLDIPQNVSEPSPIFGTNNTALAGKLTFCHSDTQIIRVWIPR